MNQGKICVSVCAESAADVTSKIQQANALADVIELRFDCLEPDQISSLIKNLPKIEKTYVFTFRPKEQGGKRDLMLNERLKFWELVFSISRQDFMIDIELDPKLLLAVAPEKIERIVSFHDFKAVPSDLDMNCWLEMTELSKGTLKIAVLPSDITDTIPIWKVLEHAAAENKKIIPIAMGEAGKWTRILGLAHGAFMTYASLDAGEETAPGQITARDMVETFRVKDLDKNTDIYGIIAGDTSYSTSPYMHNAAFKSHNINAVFVPLQAKNLDEFMRRMVITETREIDLNFKGFSVTNPHKQAIIQYLNFIDETAARIGAVNTIKIEDGKISGYNTDAKGFIEPLKKAYYDLCNARVAVIGAGGAARAVIYSLRQEAANVTLLARDLTRAKILASEFELDFEALQITNRKSQFSNFDIIVNATPIGTQGGQEDESIASAEQMDGVKLVYDLVYNPAETHLMHEAKQAGAQTIGGMEMLIAQGSEQYKIWTGQDAPVEEMRKAVIKRLFS